MILMQEQGDQLPQPVNTPLIKDGPGKTFVKPLSYCFQMFSRQTQAC